MDLDVIYAIKFVHALGASVLFGTGLGIAFFMFKAHRTGHPGVIALVARFVVIADFVFIATAVVVQPISGFALAWAIGLTPLNESWIVASLWLYVLVGLCWLPVVFIQMRIRDLAHEAAIKSKPLPKRYYRLYRIWFWLGWPAFAGVLAIFALMIWQPHWY
jgi:uncharacterized membrane protein